MHAYRTLAPPTSRDEPRSAVAAVPTQAGALRAGLDALLLPALGAMLGYAAIAQGAFYPPQAALAGGAGAVLATLVALRAPDLLRRGTAGFALLLAGLVLGAAANGWPGQAGLPAAALVAAFGSFLAGRRIVDRGDRQALLLLLSWLGAGLALLGLVGLAFHLEPWAMFATDLWRVATTLTYANAAGSIFLLALPAALLLARDRPGPVARLGVFLILTALLSSLSRGAFAGAAVFTAVALSLGGRRVVAAALRPSAGAVLATVGLLPSIVGPPRPILAMAGIAAGAVVSGLPPLRRGALRQAALVAGVVLAAAVPLLAGTAWPRLTVSRLDLSTEPRFAAWSGIWAGALDRPLFGTGPGTYAESESGRQIVARFAHNEYLQVLVETGAVGLAGVVGATIAFAAWAFRRRRGETSAVAIAACASFLVHSAVDFIWRFPLLVAVAFLWLALAAPTPPEVDA